MQGDPHWSVIVSALAIAFVSIFGAYIAWNQWRTNHDILRERLFDRRYELYEATQGVLLRIAEEKGLSWEAAKRFSENAQRAHFMVSSDDAHYFEILRQKAIALANVTSLTDHKLPSHVAKERQEQQELCNWFNDQFEEVFSRMSKYLLFDK